MEVAPYTGANPLYRHGRIGVSKDRRTSSTPTARPSSGSPTPGGWGCASASRGPADFQALARDRVDEGLHRRPDRRRAVPRHAAPSTSAAPTRPASPGRRTSRASTPPTSTWPTCASSGWCARGWCPASSAAGATYLPWMGVEKMKQHWRNLVARWGAYPVVWCLAGEARMPYYLSTTKEQDEKAQQQRVDRGGALRALDRPVPRPRSPSTRPARAGSRSTTLPCSTSTCCRPGTATGRASPTPSRCVDGLYAREPRMPDLRRRGLLRGHRRSRAGRRCSA